MTFDKFVNNSILESSPQLGVHQSWFPNNAWYFLRQNSAILTNLVADLDKTSFGHQAKSKMAAKMDENFC